MDFCMVFITSVFKVLRLQLIYPHDASSSTPTQRSLLLILQPNWGAGRLSLSKSLRWNLGNKSNSWVLLWYFHLKTLQVLSQPFSFRFLLLCNTSIKSILFIQGFFSPFTSSSFSRDTLCEGEKASIREQWSTICQSWFGSEWQLNFLRRFLVCIEK